MQHRPPAQHLALYLCYQTTHERAFHEARATLLKLRVEREKLHFGFVSQKRWEAA